MDFVWNGQNLAAESKGNITNAYTYDMTGVHIANQNGTVTSYLKDYHGNVIGKITKSGERVTTTDYDAFGNRWMGETPDPFGYCGEYLDSESGLIYLRNRYYDTTSGRFITQDPVKDGVNWYSYAGNNPVMFVDPSGLYESEFENLMVSLMRLVDNKVNYQNYLHDRDFGTSYGGPYYSGPNQDEYYDIKFENIHGWANIERDKIRNNSYLNENPELQAIILEIIDLEGGGSIEEVSTSMYIVSYYADQVDKGNTPSYSELKDEYNSHVKENTMYLYEFSDISNSKEAKNTMLHWLRTPHPSSSFRTYKYNNRTVEGVGIGVEQQDVNEKEQYYGRNYN